MEQYSHCYNGITTLKYTSFSTYVQRKQKSKCFSCGSGTSCYKMFPVLSYLKNLNNLKHSRSKQVFGVAAELQWFWNALFSPHLNSIETMVYINTWRCNLNAGCWAPLSIVDRTKSFCVHQTFWRQRHDSDLLYPLKLSVNSTSLNLL